MYRKKPFIRTLALACCLLFLILPAGAAEAAAKSVVHSADIDHNGDAEKIEVSVYDEITKLPGFRVLSNDGKDLGSVKFDFPHPDHNLFLCTVDGQDYLMDYVCTIEMGFGIYNYNLLRLWQGELVIVKRHCVPFDVYGCDPLDVKELVLFFEETNALLAEATPLILCDMDDFVVCKKGMKNDFRVDYSWLDDGAVPANLYQRGDDLSTKLERYSAYAQKMWKEHGDLWR